MTRATLPMSAFVEASAWTMLAMVTAWWTFIALRWAPAATGGPYFLSALSTISCSRDWGVAPFRTGYVAGKR